MPALPRNKNLDPAERARLRDQFATAVLQGSFHHLTLGAWETQEATHARQCYAIADAMLEAREK
jgi:hypothetical protein